MCFKIEWASLIVGRKFTVFVLFYFRFEGNFQVQASGGVGGGLYLEGRFNGGFFAFRESDLNYHQNATNYPFWEKLPSCSLKRNNGKYFPPLLVLHF